LAYRLKLPESWKIHPVLSVAQLEPAPASDDFNRTAPPPPPIQIDGEDFWEMEAIIDAAVRGRGRNRKKHYLVRWRGYGPEEDRWIPESEMENAEALIREFEVQRKDKLQVVA